MTVATFVSAILKQIPNIGKCKHDFLTHLIPLVLGIRGRVNFKQMSRYGSLNETTYHNQFKAGFDFIEFNQKLISANGSGHLILVYDPSYLPKAGSKTPHVGNFWSGCAGRMCHGLEIGVAALVDVDLQTSFHLDAVQTPNAAELKAQSKSLLDYYAEELIRLGKRVEKYTNYAVVDAFFAKAPFINRVLAESHLHVICRLRDDAVVRYLYDGPQKPNGRRREYGANINWKKIDKQCFKLVYEDEKCRIWDAKVNYSAFKRNIRVAYVEYLKPKEASTEETTDQPTEPIVECYKIYFATDLNLPAFMIVKYYKLRFQIEFEIRDGKQFTGLTDCQSRNEVKMDFHVNTSLTAVSVAKAVYWCEARKQNPTLSFSMADVKTLHFNELFLEKVFSMSAIAAEALKTHPDFHNLLTFGAFHHKTAA
jgi:hypothetical protein